MASFNSLILTVLEICAFKVKKTGHFLGKFPPYEFQKVGTKSLISEFSKLVFKYLL